MMRIMISIPRASLGLSSPFLLLVGLSGTAIDCLSLVTCPSPFVLLYYPFPLFLPRSSTAGRYDVISFPSGLCRITLNLFFLLLSTSLDQSPLCCNVSCRVVSCLWFRGLSCPSSFPCVLRPALLRFFSFFILDRKCY
jgi:hypothetical protein